MDTFNDFFRTLFFQQIVLVTLTFVYLYHLYFTWFSMNKSWIQYFYKFSVHLTGCNYYYCPLYTYISNIIAWKIFYKYIEFSSLYCKILLLCLAITRMMLRKCLMPCFKHQAWIVLLNQLRRRTRNLQKKMIILGFHITWTMHV